MRHALILLPVLTLGASAVCTTSALAAPDAANSSADASVASENLVPSDLSATLGVQGLPALEPGAPVKAGVPGEDAATALAKGAAPRATYVKTAHAKLPYTRGSAKAQTALWTAIRSGDASGLEAAIKGGAGVDAPNQRGITPLMAVAKSGDSDLMALLLSRDADIEQTDGSGATALFYAVEGRSQVCADALLQAGANSNAVTVRGETALNRLCSALSFLKASPVNAYADEQNTARRQKVVDLMVSLLCHGANPNLAAPGAPMPLAVAARNGDVGVVQMLLSGGADATGGGASMPDAREGRFETPLAAVLGAGNRARIEQLFLTDGGLINDGLRTELRDAAQKNDLAIVQALLDKGAQVGDGMDRFALLEVAARSSAGGSGGDIVRLLAKSGASPLVDDTQRRLAFNDTLGDEGGRLAEADKADSASKVALAAYAQDEFEPRLSGREVKPTSRITEAAPAVAVASEPSGLLVAATPVPDAARLAQSLPALWDTAPRSQKVAPVPAPQLTMPVVWRGVESVVSGNLTPTFNSNDTTSSGALTDTVSAAKVEARTITSRTGAPRLLLRLAQPQAPRLAATSLTTVLSTAKLGPGVGPRADAAVSNTIAAQVRANFDAHYGAPQGYTPLIQATRAGQVEAVQALLDGGADPNGRDHDGKTPLMHLCGTGRAAWVRQLPRRRVEALVGISDDDPRAVSRVVSYTEKRQWRQWAEEGDVAMVQALLKAGAEVNARDREGRTPLMYAARRSSPSVVRALVAAGADINAQDRVGKTAIMQIIGGGRVAAAASWVSPVLEREARHAMALARSGSLNLVQKAMDAQSRFELHRDLVKQEAERDDDIILCELRRARANIGLRDLTGRTVLDQALAAGQQSAVRWLMGELY